METPNIKDILREAKQEFTNSKLPRKEWDKTRVELVSKYNDQMVDCYRKWLNTHDDVPYSYVADKDERVLARWFRSRCRDKTIPEGILKEYHSKPFDHVRRYREWTYVHGKLPSTKGTNRRELRLANWAVAIHISYFEGKLSLDDVQRIKSIIGETWLDNAQHLTK